MIFFADSGWWCFNHTTNCSISLLVADLNPRPTIIDAETANLGATIETQQAEALAEHGARRKRQRAGNAAMGALGLPVLQGEDFDQERVEVADRLKRQLEEFSEENPK